MELNFAFILRFNSQIPLFEQAVLIVADAALSLEVSGHGDVLEAHDGVLAVGSGGPFAAAAARALFDVPNLTAKQICEKAMKVAADMCCYTNHNFIYETLPNTANQASQPN
ncbi:heat shock protein hslv, putative [Eimeria tenella]|uniref:Heat shock protein hslv, putative n=1 Tax=Eimeria tenella TaxID=5802 RepID=U6KKI8_EIMTE|nr:heat shock protein hslv, putative [Eimeria tenella]CDJ38545.1 heat shock protein hslv, putative [Eimeria tenella]|eukprot:XP_013229383.1 heat shock protein hslv, putative [Eimeria tenella]